MRLASNPSMQARPQALKPGGWGQEDATGSAHSQSDEIRYPDINSAHADYFDWTVSLEGQEVDITSFAGESSGTGAGAFSSAAASPQVIGSGGYPFWVDSNEAQAAFEGWAGSSDPQDSHINRLDAREDFSSSAATRPSLTVPKSASNSQRSGSPRLKTEESPSPAKAQTDGTEASNGPQKTAASAGATSGDRTTGSSRPTVRRVQFRDMTQAPREWTRSDGGSSLNSTSPSSMMKVDSADEEQRPSRPPTDANGGKTSILRSRQVDAYNDGETRLPAEKGFPIQIGSELFRLSGASLMSDAPSYFSRFFEEQMKNSDDSSTTVKTLYIDRDPITFQDIALHLQGYRVLPRDGYHYVKLFADAQFYGLPKLIKQLFESEYFIRIGEKDFRIAKDLFSSPGNTPNFFTLGFAIFTPTSGEIFPGLSNEGLFRPPSIESPAVLNRSSATFTDILHLLRGYPLEIRSPEHRTQLLRDCRYYHFRGLEQQLIQHSISYNVSRQRSEIAIRLEDIRQSGVSFASDVSPADRSALAGWVNYSRPFVDETSYELVVELSDESARVSLRTQRAEFFGQTKARITSLFQVVANKMNLPTHAPLGLMMSSGGAAAQPVSPGNTPLSDDLVKVAIERDAHVLLDGEEYDTANLPPVSSSACEDECVEMFNKSRSERASSAHLHPMSRSPSAAHQQQPPPRKRARRGSLDDFGEWIIRRGQWRLRVQPRSDRDDGTMEIVMMAVKLDAVSGQRGRNAGREFLT